MKPIKLQSETFNENLERETEDLKRYKCFFEKKNGKPSVVASMVKLLPRPQEDLNDEVHVNE
jgi:hypothetical protein